MNLYYSSQYDYDDQDRLLRVVTDYPGLWSSTRNYIYDCGAVVAHAIRM